MSHSRYLIPVLATLLLAAAPLRAQTDAADNSSASPNGTGEEPAAAQPTPAPSESASGGGSAGAGNRSPFDYQASEQISEDLPVSFPVDI